MKTAAMALAFLLCATTAFAIVARPRDTEPMPAPVPRPAAFAYTPEGFALAEETAGLRLTGGIETPTPGYRYEILNVEPAGDGGLHGVLRLTGPDGAVIQVISSLAIDYVFPQPADSLSLSVEKQFNWGPDVIECKRTGAAQ
jgi:hypothetical protein